MAIFFVTLIFSFLIYLLLTIGTGNILFWSQPELVVGIIFAFITAILVKRISYVLEINTTFHFLNPWKWLLFIYYAIGPFFVGLAKANVNVAYRVITGKINPGIIKISPDLDNDMGVTLLSNSITLTPGTLTVDVDDDNNLYVHWINVKDKEPSMEMVCGSYPKWAKKIAG